MTYLDDDDVKVLLRPAQMFGSSSCFLEVLEICGLIKLHTAAYIYNSQYVM